MTPQTTVRRRVLTLFVSLCCTGSPVGAGYILGSESVLQSYQLGQSSAPFDILCRGVCLNSSLCESAHVMLVRNPPHSSAHTRRVAHATMRGLV